jgi:hypothetical protein
MAAFPSLQSEVMCGYTGGFSFVTVVECPCRAGQELNPMLVTGPANGIDLVSVV